MQPKVRKELKIAQERSMDKESKTKIEKGALSPPQNRDWMINICRLQVCLKFVVFRREFDESVSEFHYILRTLSVIRSVS